MASGETSWHNSKEMRIARRAAAVFVGAGIGSLVTFFGNLEPKEWWVPIITAVVLGLDKWWRESQEDNTK